METFAVILLLLAFCAFVVFMWFTFKQAQPRTKMHSVDIPGVRLDVTDDAKVSVRQRNGSTVIDINYPSLAGSPFADAAPDSDDASESLLLDDMPSSQTFVPGSKSPTPEDREYWRRINAIVGLTDPAARARLISLLKDAGFIDDDEPAVTEEPSGTDFGKDFVNDYYEDEYERYYQDEGPVGGSDLDDTEPPADERNDDGSDGSQDYMETNID